MKSNWKTVKLQELGRVVGGATPSTKNEAFYGGSIPWLTPKDLADYSERYISKGERSITEEGLNSCSTELLPAGTVLFSSRAPIGYVAIASNPICTNQGFKSVVPDTGVVDPLFLYYLLVFNKEKIKSAGSGTTFKEVSGNVMKNIEVEIPTSVDYQRKIAQILGSIDNQIESNARINKNLLDQVIALSKHIQESSSNMGVLSEIAQYSRNKVPVSSLDHNNYYSTENILANKGGSTRAEKLPSTELTIAVEPGDTLVSNIRPYFKKLVFVNRSGGCSNDVLCLHPLKPELQYYLYSVIYDDRFFDFMTKGSKGTKMPRGDKAQIMSYPLCLLSKEGLERFNGLVTPIFQEIKQLDYESRLLTQLRDELLPRLLSGEIELQ